MTHAAGSPQPEERPLAAETANGRDLGEILFVLPTSLQGQRGPVAGWLNTAGWAAAARELGFGATVITPVGRLDASELRDRASLPAGEFREISSRTLVSRLPLTVKVLLKDLREFLRSRRFARFVVRTSEEVPRPLFVWQRHELFHTAGAEIATRFECPLVLFVAAPKVWEARRWGVRRPGWERLAESAGDAGPIRRADVVACVSEEVARALADIGVDPHRIVLTPSTADTTLFQPGVDGSATRSKYAVGGRLVLGWVGSFRPFHGVDTLLSALESPSLDATTVTVLLIGDGPERRQLEEQVAKRGLSDRVHFVGAVQQAHLPPVLAACDLAVVTSRPGDEFHYSPLKMWEYLAMGIPSIVPSVGIPGRLLQDRGNVMMYPPGDPESLARVIAVLGRDPTLRAQLGVAGRRVAEEHSWRVQLQRIVSRLDLQIEGDA